MTMARATAVGRGEASATYPLLVEVEPGVPAEGPDRPSVGSAYRHVWARHGFPPAPHGAATCAQLWANSVRRHGISPCLGWRRLTADGKPGPYTFISYCQADEQVRGVAAGLAACGLRGGDRIGVFAANCPEWAIVLQACNRHGYVCVPVYDTLGAHAVQYVIRHSGMRALFVASEKLHDALAAMAVQPAAGGNQQQQQRQLDLLIHWGPQPMGHLHIGFSSGSSSLGSSKSEVEENGGGIEVPGHSGRGSPAVEVGRQVVEAMVREGREHKRDGVDAVGTAAAGAAVAGGRQAGQGPVGQRRETGSGDGSCGVCGNGGGLRSGRASGEGVASSGMEQRGSTGGASSWLQPSFPTSPHVSSGRTSTTASPSPEMQQQPHGQQDEFRLARQGGGGPSGAAGVSFAGRTLGFGELVQLGGDATASGQEREEERTGPAPEDLATIMYTSGTTGDPKGVQLTHAAVVAAVSSLSTTLDRAGEHMGPGDAMLSYLPLAHIFDRVAEEVVLCHGGAVGYWNGDVAALAADAAALRPTLFIGVPRVFETMMATVESRIRHVSWLRRRLYGKVYGSKLAAMKAGAYRGRPGEPPLRCPTRVPGLTALGAAVERLAFRRIRAALGGRLRLVVSGGAPLAPRVEEFLRVTMGCPVLQGYGLTETCAASFLQQPYAGWEQFATVGPPQPCTEFRLMSLPELGYAAEGGGGSSARPAGELLLRGPQLFTGYYQQPDLTREAMLELPPPPPPGAGGAAGAAGGGRGASTSGGGGGGGGGAWFRTGDVAALHPDGSVAIVDRVKNLFKMSQGEYVSPERLEAVYGQAKLVEQVWVYGSSHRRSLVAVVVPRREELLRMLGRAGQVAISPPHPLPQQLPTAASAVVSGGSGTGGGVTGTHGAAAAGETVQEGRGEALEGDGKGGSGGKGEGALEEARRVAQVSAVPQPVAGGDAEARRAAGDLAAEPAGAVEGGGGGPAGAGAGGMGAEGDKASTLVSSLCAVPQVVQQVLKALQEVGRANRLKGFELVRAVHLVPEPFSPDNGLLTPTLKLRRPALTKRFAAELEGLYGQLGEA